MDRDTQTPARTAFQRYRDRRYFPALDGVRALCILGVIGSHMTDKPGWAGLSGGLGVNVFFILSGYLITMLALREERSRGQERQAGEDQQACSFHGPSCGLPGPRQSSPSQPAIRNQVRA
jgi:hypothetical protein